MIQQKIEFINETLPGKKWIELYNRTKESYLEWYSNEPEAYCPSYLDCYSAMKKYMPELLPIWKHLMSLIKADDTTSRMLSLYCTPPIFSGCAQLVINKTEPVLIRNYDFHPEFFEGRVLYSKWHDKKVIGMSDSLWGITDGINENGLSVSLTFGGQNFEQKGFNIALILRYILETCSNVEEAVKVLKRIPCNLSYNITLLDQHTYKTVYLCPSKKLKITNLPYATNHQDTNTCEKYLTFSQSREREVTLKNLSKNKDLSEQRVINSFLLPPLFSNRYNKAFGTLFTSVYYPKSYWAQFKWEDTKKIVSFNHFKEEVIIVKYKNVSKNDQTKANFYKLERGKLMTTNKVAVVTGANRGLGFELCRQLGNQGFTVVLASRNKTQGTKAAKKLQKEGLDVRFKILDVKKNLMIKHLTDYINREFGRLDLLVNNAAIFLGNATVSEVTTSEIRETVETNTFGPLRLLQALSPVLKQTQFSQVINVTSEFGSLLCPGFDSAAYRLSKASLNFITKMFAEELAPFGVTVKTASPGWINTKMGGENAPRSAEQGAQSVLASVVPVVQNFNSAFSQIQTQEVSLASL